MQSLFCCCIPNRLHLVNDSDVSVMIISERSAYKIVTPNIGTRNHSINLIHQDNVECQESGSSQKRVWITKSVRHIVLRVNLHLININECDEICTMKTAEC